MNAPASFDWNRARAFLATVEGGSLSAAARALRSSQPTVGRHIAALEAELGAVLFERVGNRLVPTPLAHDLVEHVRAMDAAAHRVMLTATGRAEALAGSVCVSASEGISVFLLPPIVRSLRRRYPGIELEVLASNLPSDLGRREADIAVRNFRPKEPELIARKLRESRARFYATPDYVARIGSPSTAAELDRAELIAFEPKERYMEGLRSMGVPVTPQSFPVTSSNHMVHWALARAGVCVCMLMEEIGDADSALVRVLPGMPAFSVPLWLTCRRELHTNRRVRVVFDALAEGLSNPGGHADA